MDFGDIYVVGYITCVVDIDAWLDLYIPSAEAERFVFNENGTKYIFYPFQTHWKYVIGKIQKMNVQIWGFLMWLIW